MSANVIIFDGMYTADQMRNIDKAKNLVEEATRDIKRTMGSHSWKCPEARTIDSGLESAASKLTRLNQGLIRTGIALGNGLKGFHELEERSASQADGLANTLKEKTGITATDRTDGGETTLGTTIIPGIGAESAGVAAQIHKLKDFIDEILKGIEKRRQEQAKKLEDFFYENFPWLKKDDAAASDSTPASTPETTPQSEPMPEPEPEPVSEPVAPSQSGGWDASGGWDSVGDSFPNKRPDFNSVYYNGDNPTVRQRAYGKEGRHGADSIDCCFYARARAMEVNGWTKTYGTYTKDYSTDAIKAGNRVVRFDTGRGSEMHFVFVEHYDPSTDTVYFSDSNMGGSPATDGSLKSRSFSDFLNYFPNGRYVYTENP